MKMKYLISLVSSAILLLSFGDKSQNSFSQDVKKDPEQSKTAKVNPDSVKLAVVYDSLKKETEKTKIIVAETAFLTKESEQLTQDLLVNKGKHIAVYNLANQTLKVAVYKQKRVPMIFVTAPAKTEAQLPVDLSPVVSDTVIKPLSRRTFFDKLFFRKRNPDNKND